MNCYEEELLEFADPLFRTISTAYVITMVGSKRRDGYMRQLREYRPTARVVVLHNRGFTMDHCIHTHFGIPSRHNRHKDFEDNLETTLSVCETHVCMTVK